MASAPALLLPALDALKSAAVDAPRPLMDNFSHVLSLKDVVDVNDYNVGMTLGVIMAGIGCYQLFKTDPWTCLDVVLGYAFYKLIVLSSQVHRRGFANDLITAMKTAIAIVVLIKNFRKNLNPCSITRLLYQYTATSYFAITGWKHPSRNDLMIGFKALRTKAGRRESAQHLFNPVC